MGCLLWIFLTKLAALFSWLFVNNNSEWINRCVLHIFTKTEWFHQSKNCTENVCNLVWRVLGISVIVLLMWLVNRFINSMLSSEAQTFARLQYFCTFVIVIKDRMQYCMEEPKRGCRARALSIGTRSSYALRATLRASPAGVIMYMLLLNSSVLVSQKYVNIIAFNSTHYIGFKHEIARHSACLTLFVSAEI